MFVSALDLFSLFDYLVFYQLVGKLKLTLRTIHNVHATGENLF